MGKILNLKIRVNKNNKQINLNPRKADLPKGLSKNLTRFTKLKVSIEGWE